MEKFECDGCGLCCKKFGIPEDNTQYPCFYDDPYNIRLIKPTITIYDFERRDLLKEASVLGIQFEIIPLDILFDLKSNKSLILTWTIPDNAKCCPFLSIENKCRIYSNRPLSCRSFPVMTDFYHGFLTKNMQLHASLCPKDISAQELQKKIEICLHEKSFKTLLNFYGDCFKANLEEGHLRAKIAEYVGNLVKNKQFRPAKKGYDFKFLIKRIQQSEKEPLQFPEETVTFIKSSNFSEEFLRRML